MKKVIAALIAVLLLAYCAPGTVTEDTAPVSAGAEGSFVSDPVSDTSSSPAAETKENPNMGKSGLKRDSVVVFTGDSILDDWRNDRNDPTSLGKADGPAHMFSLYLNENYPDDNITVYNTAYTGYTVQMLYQKYEQYITDLNPDYIVMYIGTNNAWHDSRDMELVEKDFNTLLDAVCAKTNAEVILMEPYLFESDMNFTAGVPLNTYVGRMAEISDMVCRTGAERGFPVIYCRELFRIAMEKYGYKYTRELTSDGIHPRKTGYRILFDALMAEMKINGYQPKYKIDVDSYRSKYLNRGDAS